MIRTMIVIMGLLLVAFNAYAKNDLFSNIEQRSKELDKKEEVLRKETARFQTLKKEIEEDITKYTALLKQIEKSLKEAEDKGNKRLKHLAKAYEAMQPEAAATRLAGLEDKTAVRILLKMSSKKAGFIIGNMQTEKATTLTKEIAKLKK